MTIKQRAKQPTGGGKQLFEGILHEEERNPCTPLVDERKWIDKDTDTDTDTVIDTDTHRASAKQQLN